MKDQENIKTHLDSILKVIETQMQKTRDYSLTHYYVQVYLCKRLLAVKNG
jgi:hypothetical protein